MSECITREVQSVRLHSTGTTLGTGPNGVCNVLEHFVVQNYNGHCAKERIQALYHHHQKKVIKQGLKIVRKQYWALMDLIKMKL